MLKVASQLSFFPGFLRRSGNCTTGACLVVSNVRFRYILSPAIWRISVSSLTHSVRPEESERSTSRRNALFRSVSANNWVIGPNANGIDP